VSRPEPCRVQSRVASGATARPAMDGRCSSCPDHLDGLPGLRSLQRLVSGRPAPKPPPLALREATPHPLRARIQPRIFQALRPHRALVTDGASLREIVRGLWEEVANALAPTGGLLPPRQDVHVSRVRAPAGASIVTASLHERCGTGVARTKRREPADPRNVPPNKGQQLEAAGGIEPPYGALQAPA
jgi:hypothetical protein